MDALVGLSGVLVSWTVLASAGYLVARGWGLRPRMAAPAATPVAFALIAAWALVLPLGRLSFSLPSVAGAFAAVGLTGLLVRRALPRSARPRPGPAAAAGDGPPRPELFGLVLLGTVVLSTLVFLMATGWTLETASQTWDGLAHQNAVRYITESGVSSPSHALDFSVAGRVPVPYYPSGFQSVAAVVMQLLGSDAVLASNVAAVLLAGALWPSTMVLFVNRLLGGSPRLLAATALLSLGFWGMPWAPLGWGVLWPSAGAAAFTALLLAGAVGLLGLGCRPTSRAGSVLFCASGVAGMALFQPRSLLLVLPVLLVIWLAFVARRALAGLRSGSPVRAVRIAVAGLGLAVLGLSALALLGSSPKFTAIDWPVTQPVGAGLVGYLVGGPNHTVREVLGAALLLVGAVLALRSGRTGWLVVAYAVAALVDVATASLRDGWVTEVSRLWYGDRYRSATMAPLVGVPLAVMGARGVWQFLESRAFPRFSSRSHPAGGRTPSRRTVAVLSLVAVAVTAGAFVPSPASYLSSKYVGASLDPVRSLVGPDEAAFFSQLDRWVRSDEYILNNPRDGSALIYAYTGRHAVFTLATDDSSATPHGVYLRSNLVVETDRERLCTMLLADRIGWVLNGGRTFRDGLILESPAPGMEVPPGFPLTTLVAQSGQMRLYRVTGCPAEGT